MKDDRLQENYCDFVLELVYQSMTTSIHSRHSYFKNTLRKGCLSLLCMLCMIYSDRPSLFDSAFDEVMEETNEGEKEMEQEHTRSRAFSSLLANMQAWTIAETEEEKVTNLLSMTTNGSGSHLPRRDEDGDDDGGDEDGKDSINNKNNENGMKYSNRTNRTNRTGRRVEVKADKIIHTGFSDSEEEEEKNENELKTSSDPKDENEQNKATQSATRRDDDNDNDNDNDEKAEKEEKNNSQFDLCTSTPRMLTE